LKKRQFAHYALLTTKLAPRFVTTPLQLKCSELVEAVERAAHREAGDCRRNRTSREPQVRVLDEHDPPREVDEVAKARDDAANNKIIKLVSEVLSQKVYHETTFSRLIIFMNKYV